MLCVWLLSLVACCEGVFLYSSFWAPLFDRSILNYRVDVPFSEDGGRSARGAFRERYGDRAGGLIEQLGTGGVRDTYTDTQVPNNVKVTYTHPANNIQ